MVHLRQEKIDRIADDIPPVEVYGARGGGELLLLGWGSTFGAIRAAVIEARGRGLDVSHAHLRHLNPFPKDLGDVLKSYKKVIVPEMNLGQLNTMIRAKYLVASEGLNKVQGKPFKVTEILERIELALKKGTS